MEAKEVYSNSLIDSSTLTLQKARSFNQPLPTDAVDTILFTESKEVTGREYSDRAEDDSALEAKRLIRPSVILPNPEFIPANSTTSSVLGAQVSARVRPSKSPIFLEISKKVVVTLHLVSI